MSVLEKIVQAELDAKELLAKIREDNTKLLSDTHDELATLRAENALAIAREINALNKKADHEIEKLATTFAAKKETITNEIEKSAKANQSKLVDKVFKDIVEKWLF